MGEEKFYLGVEDTFELKNSDDLVVVGRAHGTVRTMMGAYLSNPGDDDNQISVITIEGIEIERSMELEATDCNVGLKIKDGKKLGIKTGSVLYSRSVSVSEVHDTYIQALGDGYISFKHMELSDEEYERMSLTDLCEVRRLFKWIIDANKEQETEEIAKGNKEKLDRIGAAMAKKIFEVDEIYTVVNKKTGEPHMYSKTFDRGDGQFYCTPPDICLITKAYAEVYKERLDTESLVVVKVENGETKKGIFDFLGSVFYLNGACGVNVLYDDFSIDAGMLVPKPDYSNVPPIQVPVTNPDVERWLLLMAQIGGHEEEEARKIYGIYLSFMFRQMANAKFLIPMKMDAKMTEPDSSGNCVVSEGGQMSIATMSGKAGRDAVKMFTDWKRFRMVFPESEGWGGMVETISGMIDIFDCAINPTQFAMAGCYISKDAFDNNIKQHVEMLAK